MYLILRIVKYDSFGMNIKDTLTVSRSCYTITIIVWTIVFFYCSTHVTKQYYGCCIHAMHTIHTMLHTCNAYIQYMYTPFRWAYRMVQNDLTIVTLTNCRKSLFMSFRDPLTLDLCKRSSSDLITRWALSELLMTSSKSSVSESDSRKYLDRVCCGFCAHTTYINLPTEIKTRAQ